MASTVHRLLVSADILNRERSRWFLWVPVCFAIGIAVYFELRFEPSLAYLALPLVGTIVLICSQHRVLANQPLAVALMLVVAGASVSKLRTIWVEAPILERPLYAAAVEGAHSDASGQPFREHPATHSGVSGQVIGSAVGLGR